MKRTFIVAEAGANHNRDINLAFKLIDNAKWAGADAVKFQTYSSETLYARNTPDFAGYRNINQLIKEIELPREWQSDLKTYCDKQGIEFMSTPFDEKAVDQLVGLGVKRLKIAGFESTDFRFVEMVASAALPLIISLGIGFDHKYIERLIEIAEKYGNHLTLLHCNNAYPTPMKDIDLNKVKQLAGDTRYSCGLSDHTESVITPALAVAVGAETIEKHFTLDKTMKGPDHPFALEPGDLKQMVSYIRLCEEAFIENKNLYSRSEMSFINARRSVVTRIAINPGEVLTTENITTKRPFLEGTIPAMDFFNILGKTVREKIDEDTPLRKDQIL